MANKTLRLILGDQLNSQHSWFAEQSEDVTYLMIEAHSESEYVSHHIQKVVAFFSSMRAFATQLNENGHQVIYVKLDDPNNKKSISSNAKWIAEQKDFNKFEYQLPDEYRLDQELSKLADQLSIPITAVDSEHFLTSRDELSNFFKGKKTYLMESFYRSMRKKYDLLMVNEGPEGGKWNFDHDNRHGWTEDFQAPEPLLFDKDVSDIVAMLKKEKIASIGNIDEKHFPWPTSRKESLQLLDYFLKNHLQEFGTYQDMMDTRSTYLNHSRLSFSINVKMLSPLEVVRETIAYWRENQDVISISQVEGFIRQIVGWREYMRGMYWAKMPDYAQMNYFQHSRKLPSWFWDGNTKMNCLSKTINGSLENAYAHHIQRLMVTGNFALLAGIDPSELDLWYLGIYIDAIEWVEITNTRGMSQFADGGLVGTKPYVSTSNYLDKMSNYCKACHYSKTKREGEKACPFNSLYWNFYHVNRNKLEKNPRIGFVYNTLDKMKYSNKTALFTQAEKYLENLDSL
ncbi:cryptochrome/photolyase family protein [Fulvivirgaceae bacterium LMO-SS25]